MPPDKVALTRKRLAEVLGARFFALISSSTLPPSWVSFARPLACMVWSSKRWWSRPQAPASKYWCQCLLPSVSTCWPSICIRAGLALKKRPSMSRVNMPIGMALKVCAISACTCSRCSCSSRICSAIARAVKRLDDRAAVTLLTASIMPLMPSAAAMTSEKLASRVTEMAAAYHPAALERVFCRTRTIKNTRVLMTMPVMHHITGKNDANDRVSDSSSRGKQVHWANLSRGLCLRSARSSLNKAANKANVAV